MARMIGIAIIAIWTIKAVISGDKSLFLRVRVSDLADSGHERVQLRLNLVQLRDPACTGVNLADLAAASCVALFARLGQGRCTRRHLGHLLHLAVAMEGDIA